MWQKNFIKYNPRQLYVFIHIYLLIKYRRILVVAKVKCIYLTKVPRFSNLTSNGSNIYESGFVHYVLFPTFGILHISLVICKRVLYFLKPSVI